MFKLWNGQEQMAVSGFGPAVSGFGPAVSGFGPAVSGFGPRVAVYGSRFAASVHGLRSCGIGLGQSVTVRCVRLARQLPRDLDILAD